MSGSAEARSDSRNAGNESYYLHGRRTKSTLTAILGSVSTRRLLKQWPMNGFQERFGNWAAWPMLPMC